MTSYYTDDEQVERLKEWWKNYGPALTVGVVLGVGLLGGTKYWRHYSAQKSVEASAVYQTLLSDLRQNKFNDAVAAGKRLTGEYSSTLYADFAALALAKANFELGNIDVARVELERLASDGASDAIRQVARLRMADLLRQQGKLDEALAALGDTPASGFESEHYELNGDLLLAKGDSAQARQAYEKAMQAPVSTPDYRQVLQMKLDSLGGSAGQ